MNNATTTDNRTKEEERRNEGNKGSGLTTDDFLLLQKNSSKMINSFTKEFILEDQEKKNLKKIETDTSIKSIVDKKDYIKYGLLKYLLGFCENNSNDGSNNNGFQTLSDKFYYDNEKPIATNPHKLLKTQDIESIYKILFDRDDKENTTDEKATKIIEKYNQDKEDAIRRVSKFVVDTKDELVSNMTKVSKLAEEINNHKELKSYYLSDKVVEKLKNKMNDFLFSYEEIRDEEIEELKTEIIAEIKEQPNNKEFNKSITNFVDKIKKDKDETDKDPSAIKITKEDMFGGIEFTEQMRAKVPKRITNAIKDEPPLKKCFNNIGILYTLIRGNKLHKLNNKLDKYNNKFNKYNNKFNKYNNKLGKLNTEISQKEEKNTNDEIMKNIEERMKSILSNSISKLSAKIEHKQNQKLVLDKLYTLITTECREFEKLLPADKKEEVMKSLFDDYFGHNSRDLIKSHYDKLEGNNVRLVNQNQIF